MPPVVVVPIELRPVRATGTCQSKRVTPLVPRPLRYRVTRRDAPEGQAFADVAGALYR